MGMCSGDCVAVGATGLIPGYINRSDRAKTAGYILSIIVNFKSTTKCHM